jgi:TPR repeat protein
MSRRGAAARFRGTLGRAAAAAVALVVLTALTAAGADAPEFGRGLREFYHGDHAIAARTWQAAAEVGDAKSQSSLGFLYLFGFGVPKDIGTAVFWYRKAADQNEPEAQAYLGTFYVDGTGVERNLVQALKWCELAVWHGASRGMNCRGNALRQMSALEMREGWRLFNEWLEQHPRMAQR